MSQLSFWKRPLTYLTTKGAQAFDFGLEQLAPGWAYERAVQRTELARLAANPRGAWRPASMGDVGSTESIRATHERIQMMWESRECINNFGFLKMLAWKYSLYVAGHIGYLPETGDVGLNAIYHDYISEWFENCDLTGRFPFHRLMGIAYMGHKIDGDSGLVVSLMDGDLKLQIIQGDRIGNPFDYSYTANYYSGVITDEFDRPTSYKVYQRDRNNIYRNPVIIPRSNFLHILNPQSSDQYRGVTVNDTAIAPCRNMFDIIQNELRAVKALSGQTAVVSSKGNSAGSEWIAKRQKAYEEALKDGAPPAMLPAQEIKGGTINYISDGDSITAFTYNRPSPSFNGLWESQMQAICNAWQADANFFSGGDAKGANIRLGSNQQQRVFAGEQGMLKLAAIKPLILLKLQFGMARGDIPAHPNYRKMQIIFGPHATCDSGNDSAADIEDIKMGITSLSEVVMRRTGNPIDQHVSRLGKDAQLILATAKQDQVPVTMIQMRTPNGNDPSGDTEPEDDDPPDDTAAPKDTPPPGNPKNGKQTRLSRTDETRDRRGRWSKVGGIQVRRGPHNHLLAKIGTFVKKHPASVLAGTAAVVGAAIGAREAVTHSLFTETGRPILPGEDLRGKRIYRRLDPKDGMDEFAKHYGVVTQGGRVLHRTTGSDKFRTVKMETFQKVGKGLTYVEEHPSDRPPSEVASAASRMSGKSAGKYKFFSNNCETSVNRVVEGTRTSRQVRDAVRAAAQGSQIGAATGIAAVTAGAALVREIKSSQRKKKT